MGSVNYTMKILTNLNIRNGASTGCKRIGSYTAGTTVKVIQIQGDWAKTNLGWCCIRSGNSTYMKMVSNTSNPSKTVSKSTAQSKLTNQKAKSGKANTSKQTAYYSDAIKNLPIKTIQGIHGMPYQFMSTVDGRLKDKDSTTPFGRKYAERILTQMPLLFITPGKPAFLTDYSDKTKRGVLMKLADSIVDKVDKVTVENLIGKPGRYYTFNFDYAAYYDYVNNMTNMCATYLGLGKEVISLGGYKGKLEKFQWNKVLTNDFQSFFNVAEAVTFYIDSENQISESFATNTKPSMLSDKINGLSDTAKEVNFLLGAGAGIQMDMLDTASYKSTVDQVNKISDKYLRGNQLFKDLGNAFSTVAVGGKLIFPEIWEDTTFSKSYSINIKLRSPDADTLSVYLNIIVPLCHLIALTAPRQMGPNGLMAPFLIKAFYKGLFNCDMGIVSGLSITKGQQHAWNVDGLPTEVDVNLEIKDLYSVLSIANIQDMANGTGFKNTCFVDYLANMCGINISKPELERCIRMYALSKTRYIQNIPNHLWLEWNQGISNRLLNNYVKYFGY